MGRRIRAKPRLLLVLVVAPALLIGLGVPRTGEAACPSSCSNYPSFEIVIENNTCSPINGTYSLARNGCQWSADLPYPFDKVTVSCVDDTWLVKIYHDFAPDVTVWDAANITGYPDDEAYTYVEGPCDEGTEGTIVVQEQ